ncbi:MULTISPECIES: DUF3108 domain-containing protein [Reichenbachiella]|uniref:DUF3108 domain-containing protein n=1 Tax=Reichenbachiella agariperforans TaxID=156994 RepID=A0A1M6VLY5_REIAG|nr:MULTISPECIES: DUF3108 domain-containing protein [Reichenbachiella]MBU2914594.1 DUF3108 domain-containing protein [Reichenbachiella agariperforans]RJE75328.1 hypothetical protein BGP76_19755 [Reichenbachiella sp. MSK19-1]SHK82557.1 Protein of unknown function [Reichenbachiella agariperforans]
MKSNILKSFIILLFIFGGSIMAQSHVHPDGELTKMKVNKLSYKFKIGWFTLGGGDLVFEENNMIIQDQYHHVVKAYAYTDGMAAFFTEMDDNYMSVINSRTLHPYLSEKHVTIKNGFWDQWNSFDYDKNEITVKAKKTKKGEKSDRNWVVNMTPDSYDIVSTFVYFMDVDWSKHKKNDTVTVMTHYKKKVYPVSLIYKGKDKIKYNDEKVDTYLTQIYLPADTEYTYGRPVHAWVSSDGRNIPLAIQCKLAFGNARCELTEVNGGTPDF